MARNFSKDEMEEQDLAAYLASDTDSGDGVYYVCYRWIRVSCIM